VPLSIFIDKSEKCAHYKSFAALGAGDARALGQQMMFDGLDEVLDYQGYFFEV